jgi:D-glycero-D-manno-heptose 1,7-bisphosphate phosphatase
MSYLIILDRDGVINQDSDNYIKSVDEFILIPKSLNAIVQLCQAGCTVVVATNQSGIARQFFSKTTLHAMHQKLQSLLAPLGGEIQHFYYCPHSPDDYCHCRKPKTGMIEKILNDFLITPLTKNSVFLVGDSLRDLQAGKKAGVHVALVKTGKGMRSIKAIAENNLIEYQHLAIYKDLAEFTQDLLQTDPH